MKFRVLIVLFFYSTTHFYCQKLTVELKSRLNKIEIYVDSIKSSKKFSESISDGYIIDENNPNRNGGFSYYEFYLPDKKELFRVEYLSSADVNVTENYFYKKHQLIFAESIVKYPSGIKMKAKIYLDSGKLIYENQSEHESSKRLIIKGNKYLREFIVK